MKMIAGPAGTLELLTYEAAEPPRACVIICHPHPVQGGTMNNKVVTTLHKAFAESNFNTIRFNFRGVGKSEGTFDEGIGEREDLLAVLAWVDAEYPDLPLYLAGFSFGAYISYSVAVDPAYSEKVKQLVSISPPVQYPEFHTLAFPSMPWVVVQGDEDDIVNAEDLYTWLAKAPQVDIIRFPTAGHFFHGQLNELRDTLKAHLVFPK